ncbi:MAG: hypothetical protein IJD43_12780 [Thermoguttaceae bacterium]|nr:hypothetical protein [Thermoguttaceae bacterium]
MCERLILNAVGLLVLSLLLAGASGCQSLRGGKDPDTLPSRATVIKRESGDDSTVSGWVGGERPSF